MLGEEFGHLGLDRLGQQGARSVAQHLGKRVGERPWLKQLDDVSIGHGVSLLCWRSGGSNTPTIRRLLPVRPSPTFAHSSMHPPLSNCKLPLFFFGGYWIQPLGFAEILCTQRALDLPPTYGRPQVGR